MLSRILSRAALMIGLFGAFAGRASDATYENTTPPVQAQTEKSSTCSCARPDGAAKNIRSGYRAAPADTRFQDSYHNDPAKMN